MLTAIVLLWIAIKLQAPLWVFTIIVLMFLTSALQLILHYVEKAQKKRLNKMLDDLDSLTGTRKSDTQRGEQE